MKDDDAKLRSARASGDATLKMEPPSDDDPPPVVPLPEELRTLPPRRVHVSTAEVATIKLLAEDPPEAYVPTRSERLLPEKKASSMVYVAALAAVLGLVVSVGRHFLENRPENADTAGEEASETLVAYRGSAPPSDADRAQAGTLLVESEAALRARSLGEARQKLTRCIELADLPDCHRQLGYLLGLSGDKSARGHLARYLALTPNAKDAPSVRAMVTTSATVSR